MIIFYISVAMEGIEDVIIIKTVPTSRSFQSIGMCRKSNIMPFCATAELLQDGRGAGRVGKA